MRLIGGAAIAFVLTLTCMSVSAPAQGQRLQDGQAIFRFDTFGDEQLWTDVLRMNDAIETVSPATALSVGLKVDVRALPPTVDQGAQGGRGRSGRSRRDADVAQAQCGRWRDGQGQRRWRAHARRDHLCALSFDRRQLADDRHRAATRRLAESRPECRRDRRAVSGTARGSQGGVRQVGTGHVRPAAPCLRRNEPDRIEQSVGAGRDPAGVRTEGRRLRDLHRQTDRSRTGTPTSASRRWAATAPSAIRASVSSSVRHPISSPRS